MSRKTFGFYGALCSEIRISTFNKVKGLRPEYMSHICADRAHFPQTTSNLTSLQLACLLLILDVHIYDMNFTNFQNLLASPFWEIAFFVFFSPIFTQPHQIWLFLRVFGLFWPSEMIINITGDEYGSILICTFFGFLHFLPFLAILGHVLHFWDFSGCWGGFGSASEL